MRRITSISTKELKRIKVCVNETSNMLRFTSVRCLITIDERFGFISTTFGITCLGELYTTIYERSMSLSFLRRRSLQAISPPTYIINATTRVNGLSIITTISIRNVRLTRATILLSVNMNGSM